MILNDDYLFGCFFSINSEQIFLIINQFNANYFSKMFRKNCVSFAFQIHTTQTQCSPITENFDKKFNKRWHISISKLYYYKNALNCISTAHKSLFECMIKRNNRRQLITDYLQFRTLPSTNSSAQCHLSFFSLFFIFIFLQ